MFPTLLLGGGILLAAASGFAHVSALLLRLLCDGETGSWLDVWSRRRFQASSCNEASRVGLQDVVDQIRNLDLHPRGLSMHASCGCCVEGGCCTEGGRYCFLLATGAISEVNAIFLDRRSAVVIDSGCADILSGRNPFFLDAGNGLVFSRLDDVAGILCNVPHNLAETGQNLAGLFPLGTTEKGAQLVADNDVEVVCSRRTASLVEVVSASYQSVLQFEDEELIVADRKECDGIFDPEHHLGL